MANIYKAIQDGTFARSWILENQAGCPTLETLRQKDAQHPIEEVGKHLRQMLP